jgi:hypothetical protein
VLKRGRKLCRAITDEGPEEEEEEAEAEAERQRDGA